MGEAAQDSARLFLEKFVHAAGDFHVDLRLDPLSARIPGRPACGHLACCLPCRDGKVSGSKLVEALGPLLNQWFCKLARDELEATMASDTSGMVFYGLHHGRLYSYVG